jgi:hypothetical protein
MVFQTVVALNRPEIRCGLPMRFNVASAVKPILVAASLGPLPFSKLTALPRVGGLHHRYEWREAA